MRRASGFSLTELLVVVAVIAISGAMAIPMLLTGLRDQRLNVAVRAVQSELQSARLLAVSSNRPMRVRFNCPSTGQFRRVELIGTPAAPDSRDSAANRCDPAVYPPLPADRNRLTRPNLDGPVRRLGQGASFGTVQTIEFWPDGSAHVQGTTTSGKWPAIGTSGVSITVVGKTTTKAITVNGGGKVNIG